MDIRPRPTVRPLEEQEREERRLILPMEPDQALELELELELELACLPTISTIPTVRLDIHHLLLPTKEAVLEEAHHLLTIHRRMDTLITIHRRRTTSILMRRRLLSITTTIIVTVLISTNRH
jgi:hypothetical protein